MGKPKRNSNNTIKKFKDGDTSDEEYIDTVDPSASEFVYDAVDEYYENEEREGAENLAKLMKRKKKPLQHDILGVASSSDEDETQTRSTRKKKSKKSKIIAAEPLPPLDSELDEDKDDDDEENMEWGKKRSAYYNADYVDEDLDDGDEANVEVAELEEQEALAIQQRMAQQLEEADYGLDFITHLKAADKVKTHTTVEEEKIDVNLSNLSKREKLKLLTEESPELLELVEDFKFQMTELKNNLQPLLTLVAKEILPPSPGVDYLKAKYQLILNYCTQIGYYFVLKSKRISVQNHPVVKRLVQFRSLLHQLETNGKSLQPEIDDLLMKIKSKQQLSQENFVRTVVPARKKLRILSNRQQTETAKEVKKEEKKNLVAKKSTKTESLTRDEENALDFYKAVRGSKKSLEDDDDDEEEPDTNLADAEAEAEASDQQEDGVEKRGINYQIAKNKGLTPHRSKEQRNPRVKHRMKFRKAKIRRKGQIREPRKELQKYGGEMSGIKATVVRSVKLK